MESAVDIGPAELTLVAFVRLQELDKDYVLVIRAGNISYWVTLYH